MKELEDRLGISSDRVIALAILFTIYAIVLGVGGKSNFTGFALIGTVIIMNTELFLFMKPGFGAHTFDDLLDYYPADISKFVPHLLVKVLAEGFAAYAAAALIALLDDTRQHIVYILIMNLRAPLIVLFAWLVAWYSTWSSRKKKDLTGNSITGPVLGMQGIILIAMLLGIKAAGM